MRCDLRSVMVADRTNEESYPQCTRPRAQIYPSKSWGRVGLCEACLIYVRAHDQGALKTLQRPESTDVALDVATGTIGKKFGRAPLRLRRGYLVCDTIPTLEEALAIFLDEDKALQKGKESRIEYAKTLEVDTPEV